MEYIICIIIMLVWAMTFYCWGYNHGKKTLASILQN